MAAPVKNKTFFNKSRKKANSTPIRRKLGNKTEDCRPVAAWVEVCDDLSGNDDAVKSAVEAEAQILRTIQEKDEKLKQFQENVKRRVQQKEKQRQHQLLENSYQAIEQEHYVMSATTRAAEKRTPRKDRCSLRRSAELNIKSDQTKHSNHGYSLRVKPDKLTSQAEKVHVYMSQARNDLLTKKTQPVVQELPGGVWKQKGRIDEDKKYMTSPDQAGRDVGGVDVDDTAGNGRTRSRSRSAGRKHPGMNPPELYPGVVEEETKKQTQSQRAMYRRLFMDMERQQVKETRRKKEEEQRIKQIKDFAESGRLQAEARVHVVVTSGPAQHAPAVVVTSSPIGDTEVEARETERYLHRLRVDVKQEMLMTGVNTPLLCNCGTDFWDTDPDTCANNCVFYRNTKAYIKALQSVLALCDQVK